MIKISIKSINSKILALYCFFIKKISEKNDLFIKQLNMPKRTKKFAILKSPHVNKKSQEHFQLITYKKTFYIKTNLKIFKTLLINKPKQIKITMRKII